MGTEFYIRRKISRENLHATVDLIKAKRANLQIG